MDKIMELTFKIEGDGSVVATYSDNDQLTVDLNWDAVPKSLQTVIDLILESIKEEQMKGEMETNDNDLIQAP